LVFDVVVLCYYVFVDVGACFVAIQVSRPNSTVPTVSVGPDDKIQGLSIVVIDCDNSMVALFFYHLDS
jgi:hypothetical protein